MRAFALCALLWQSTGIPLKPGTYTILINYDPSAWTDIEGRPATNTLTFFNQALSSGALGYSFGDDCAFGHGVYADQAAPWSQDGL